MLVSLVRAGRPWGIEVAGRSCEGRREGGRQRQIGTEALCGWGAG
jgi:hypothetical protein